jgi:general secretion pathway protein G
MKQDRLAPAGRPRRSAFTIVEILVVVVIIAALATLVVPRLFGRVGTAKQAIAKQKIEEIDKAIQIFSNDYQDYLEDSLPESLEDLVARPAAIPENAWNEPTLRRQDLIDPWGRPFLYRKPGQYGDKYDIYSLGKDGREGGEGENADVVSWHVDK